MAVVLISGCSSGFGLAFAEAFARRGDRVVATLRNPARGDELRQLIERERLDSIVVRSLDVTDPASIAAAVDETVRAEGRIDVLVNNAGIGVVGALEVLEEATLRRVFDTNVFGAVALTRAVLPHMRRQHSGRIIFTSAIGAILNTAYFGAYTASKHAVDCLAATFDIEGRPFGIRSASVLPAAFSTGIAGNLQAELGEGTPYEAASRAYLEALTGRLTNGPKDLSPVVEAVLHAATAEDPRQRYLIAPHLAAVLEPVVEQLEALHAREVASTPGAAPAPELR